MNRPRTGPLITPNTVIAACTTHDTSSIFYNSINYHYLH